MRSSRHFLRWYLAALFAIAILSVGGSLVVQHSVERQRIASTVIDAAGRQRMLSQQLALTLREWETAHGPERGVLAARVGERLDRLASAQAWLSSGPGSITPEALAAVVGGPEGVEQQLTTFSVTVRRAVGGDASAADEVSAQVTGPLLRALEAQVQAHAAAAQAQVEASLLTERWLLFAVLALLLVEALALFRPLHRALRSTLASLESAVDALSAQREHLLQVVTAAGDGWIVLGSGGAPHGPPSPLLARWFPECESKGFFETVFSAEHVAAAKATFGAEAQTAPSLVERNGAAWEVRYHRLRSAPLQVLVVVRDVSAVRALYATAQERDAAEARARLTTAERLASLGTLAAGIAHEINSPAAWIRANTDYVASRLAEPGADRTDLLETLAETREGAARICQIVDDMLRISRGVDDLPQPIDVRESLERILRLARGELQQRVVIKTDLVPVPLVRATDVELGQVFLNLLNNAAQAMPRGRAREACMVHLRTAVDSLGRVVVEIEDNGAGISNEVGKNLFTPFFTTKAAGLGTGLGLTVCHAIIARRGGELDFRSKVGEGTVFRVTIPPASDDPSELDDTTSSEPDEGGALGNSAAGAHRQQAKGHPRSSRKRVRPSLTRPSPERIEHAPRPGGGIGRRARFRV